ncbi:MAG: hypothetical protein KAS36_05860 [Anaerolineales bacterium]|nr:hypothetical protein [Anaerolineales bacterium]
MVRMENELNQQIFYRIKIQGHLKEKWAEWFNGKMIKFFNAAEDSPDTTIHLSVPDQAALRGVLNKIWDLNLTLISVNLYKDETNSGGTNEH